MQQLLAFVVLFVSFDAFPLQGQELDPVAPTSAQDSLLDAGIAFYDKGLYDEAIAAYVSILQENPANVAALAELSMTYLAKEDYANTIKHALEGLKYRSNYRAHLFLTLGNGYDMVGKSAEAISAYRAGLDVKPGDYMLHYNVGLAYYRSSDLQGARQHFHSALRARPSHASSHLALGHVYRAMKKRIPAIFAYSRFLVLEPNSGRSAGVAKTLRYFLSDSLSVRVSGPNERTVTVAPDSDQVDGDLTVLALSLAMTQAARIERDSTYSSPLGAITSDLADLFQITLELMANERAAGFCWEYYAPYFAAIQHRGLTDVFVHFIFRSLEGDGVPAHVKTDLDKEQEFKNWSASYKWPE